MAGWRRFGLGADKDEDKPRAALDLGEDVLRLAVRRRPEQPEATQFFVRRLAEGEDRVAGLIALWAAADLQTASLTLVLPRHAALVRSLSLPTENDTEINAMVALQGPLTLPYGAHDAVFGTYVVGTKRTSPKMKLSLSQ